MRPFFYLVSSVIVSVVISSVIITPMIEVVMFDICYAMAPFINGTVVIVIDTVTIVSVPGRIGIISCVGISFTNCRCRSIRVIINCNGRANYRYGYGYWNTVDPGEADAYVCVYIYLGVTGSSYEAGGDDGGEDK